MNKEKSIILFDGVCNLCNGSVNFILKRDKKKQFLFMALQSGKGKELVEKFQIPKETNSVIFIQNNTVFIESDAVLEISKLLPAPWKWTVAFKVIPIKCRDKIYQCLARNRYKWFGKQETECHFERGTTEKSRTSQLLDSDSSLRLE